eukprot:652923-Prorocentrum_lima.AAC.1
MAAHPDATAKQLLEHLAPKRRRMATALKKEQPSPARQTGTAATPLDPATAASPVASAMQGVQQG